jgi:hypothetical protein
MVRALAEINGCMSIPFQGRHAAPSHSPPRTEMSNQDAFDEAVADIDRLT